MSRTEMLGVPPKSSGRIVVKDEDVAAFVSEGYVVIEPTDLPLTGVKVPGKAKKKAAISKPDPLAGKTTEEVRSELEQARVADEEAANRAEAEMADAAEDAEADRTEDAELFAKIMRAYTPELKTIAEKYGLDINLDALGSVPERRDFVASQLGLLIEDDDPVEDTAGDGE